MEDRASHAVSFPPRGSRSGPGTALNGDDMPSPRARRWATRTALLLFLVALPLLIPSIAQGSVPLAPPTPHGALEGPAPLGSPAAPTLRSASPSGGTQVAAITEPRASALGPLPMGRILSAASEALRPSATISTTNLTGFIASAVDLTTLLSNQGTQFVMAVPSPPSGFAGGTTDVILGLAGEDLNSTVSALVGFVEATVDGETPWLPLYLVNDSGVSIVGTGSPHLGASGTPETFSMQETHGDWWSFTMNGQLIGGGLYGSGNGTADLGVSSASPLTSASVPIMTFLITQNLTTMPLTPVKTVMNLLSAQVWTPPTDGYSLIDLNTGVAGYIQNPLIPPDSVQFGGALPVLSPATELWSAASLPALSVQAAGLPSSLASTSTYPFRVWMNDSSAHPSVGVSTAALVVNVTAGTATIVGTGPSPGEAEVDYVAPAVAGPTPVTMTLTATASNYVGAVETLSLSVDPVRASVVGRAPSHVLANSTLTIPFFVNASGSPVDPPTLSSSVSGGGTLTDEWLGAHAPGVYAVQFTAPSFLRPSSSWINLTVSGVGFYEESGTVHLTVWPRALTLSTPPAQSFSPGKNGWVPVGIDSPSGELPSGPRATWNVSATGGGSGIPLAANPSVSLSGSTAEVLLSIQSTYVGTLSLSLSLVAPGFNSTSVAWTDSVTGSLHVTFGALPAQTTSGSPIDLTISVDGAGGTPLSEASVDWAAVSGGFGSSDASAVTSYTGGTGSSSLQFDTPSVSSTTTVEVSVTVSAPYYNTTTVTANATVVPPALSGYQQALNGLSTDGPALLLIVLVVIAVVLALLVGMEYGRQAEARRRPRAAPRTRATARSTPSRLDTVAPIPGAAGVGLEPLAVSHEPAPDEEQEEATPTPETKAAPEPASAEPAEAPKTEPLPSDDPSSRASSGAPASSAQASAEVPPSSTPPAEPSAAASAGSGTEVTSEKTATGTPEKGDEPAPAPQMDATPKPRKRGRRSS
jgi:hypothetical protein